VPAAACRMTPPNLSLMASRANRRETPAPNTSRRIGNWHRCRPSPPRRSCGRRKLWPCAPRNRTARRCIADRSRRHKGHSRSHSGWRGSVRSGRGAASAGPFARRVPHCHGNELGLHLLDGAPPADARRRFGCTDDPAAATVEQIGDLACYDCEDRYSANVRAPVVHQAMER
jgi:hypothetical protein